uniref:alkaline phosphatase n=1 Tax=Lygus hesperus TaxID=30085 RepID=A0A146KZL8_LYGHE
MWTLLVLAAGLRLTVSQAPGTPILGQEYWLDDGKDDLAAALNVKTNTKVAKNVILFIGDGMSPITVTATRIYHSGETSRLVWEQFEHIGLLKTYCNDKTVPDSSVTASAMFSGIKGNRATLGTDGTVPKSDCAGSLDPKRRSTSNVLHAQKAGKATGIVTNTRITHATPGAGYAHSAHRDWECDADLPEDAKACKDIARQLFEDEPGRSLNVIMGGGRQGLVSEQKTTPFDPLTSSCNRTDSRDLIQEWIDRQQNMSAKFAYVNNTGSLKNVDTANVHNLLGIFSNGHFPYNHYRNKTSELAQPSLELMATTAVKVLNNNPNGFFLMVEGGMIDMGHHKGRARLALDETVEMNKAVNSTLRLLEELGIKDDTLFIVTSDHNHGLTINGYPDRGKSILGIADKSETDGTNYTTLMYTVSGPQSFQFEVVNGQAKRREPSQDDTESWDYRQQALVLNDEGKHEGGDVNVYATGPMSHLFHRVHEQSYVAHVVQYAAQIGRYKDRNVVPSFSPSHLASSIIVFLSIVFVRFL